MEELKLDKYSNLNSDGFNTKRLTEDVNNNQIENTSVDDYSVESMISQKVYQPETNNKKPNTQKTFSSEQNGTNKISYSEYVEKSKEDELNILRVIIFAVFVIAVILSFYHVFFGSNGFNSQKEKAQELVKMKDLEKVKDEELVEKATLLKKIKRGDTKTIEKLAREKGYVYEDEKVIKIPSLKEKETTDDNQNLKLVSSSKHSPIIYLIASLIVAIGVIIVSLFVNRKKIAGS